MYATLPIRLQRNESQPIQRMCLSVQALILSHTRKIVIVNASEISPLDFLELPKTFAAFPCLRHRTLLFGYSIGSERADHVEWITAAFMLANSVSDEMCELLRAIRVSGSISVKEALGLSWDCKKSRNSFILR